MSKISQITSIDPNGQVQTQQKPSQEEGGPSFHEVLQKAAGGQEFSQKEAQTALEAEQKAVSQAGSPQAANALDQILSPKQVNGLMRAEKTLELLSDYERQLGDGSFSLKDMAGTVDSLEDQVKKLTEALNKLDPEDELKGLLQDVATTAMVETIKFKRGDYVTV